MRASENRRCVYLAKRESERTLYIATQGYTASDDYRPLTRRRERTIAEEN